MFLSSSSYCYYSVSYLILSQLLLLDIFSVVDCRLPRRRVTGRKPVETEDINGLIQLYIGVEKDDGEYLLVKDDKQNGHELVNCDIDDNFAIVVHGWRESCSTLWVRELMNNLRKHRGGCLLCFDYSEYQSRLSDRYRPLVNHFGVIASALLDVLIGLEEVGFDTTNNGFIFGFSYGARLAVQAAGAFGYQKIDRIDVCDPARPFFDNGNGRRRFNLVDPRYAAKNVLCIHTSSDKGTLTRNCHIDWVMGKCGKEQVAASDPPYGSHGLCPHFYNSAFDNNFFAIDKPFECLSNREALKLPMGFKMGYLENRTSQVRGDVYARTSDKYPYNVL